MSATVSRNTYFMREQARDKVHKIMHERGAEPLLVSAFWLALGLLLVAVNIVTITPS